MIERLLRWAVIIAIVLIVTYPAMFRPPFDATDSPSERSQMRLHTDHKTGCQYLSVRGGGITPRLAETGQHMGCKQ